MYAHYFTVEPNGVASFPVDMLRYDACFPAHEAGSAHIEASFGPWGETPEPVELVRYAESDRWFPTTGRWESFGWRVVEGSYDCTKVGH